MTIFLLWALVVLFGFHLAGHLYDMLANQPNWKSGEIPDVQRYRDFYRVASPARFFAPLVFGCTLMSIVTLAAVWKSGMPTVRNSVLLALIISLVVLVMTMQVFVPLNNFFFGTPAFDAEELRRKVSRWITLEFVRTTLLAIGFSSAIAALNAFMK
ncbi:MAG: DUF1772 domain-containing protein [Vicinamibacterales bacterium]